MFEETHLETDEVVSEALMASCSASAETDVIARISSEEQGALSTAESVKAAVASEALRFEQRRAMRHAVDGMVMAMRCDHDVNVYAQPMCSFRLKDISESGVAVRSTMALTQNERVRLFFPPHDGESAVELYGNVVRCQSMVADEMMRFELAICFDLKTAA